ncbi:hypothetical protein LZ198_10455 [Myxococcus sp. K15C18031901]|uniref:hypothetical protein n=1 Tax=Myxococcus dinghuensis TaxID=2906761 RepID=UPI0020A7B952|nr:hypothetical protein [Myxococcus dinghuensis]MCP3099292.1 hypothetical protein [Myxococcus dinghuensis]
MNEILNGLLGRAADSFARHEEDAALEQLLEAWRESRAEPVIALVQQLSDRLGEGLTPLDVGSSWETQLERRHPMDLPRMLVSLLGFASSSNWRETSRRLERLRQWPADPRFVPVLQALSRMQVVEDFRVLAAFCDVYMHVGPPFDVQLLRALKARLPPVLSFVTRQLDRVIRLGAAWTPPVLDALALERCEALREAIEARAMGERQDAGTREALLARVYDAPEDDSARMVLADQLLGLGDPLGEFIMLQFAPEPDTPRIAQLLSMNRVKWEAPLGRVIERGRTRFERGFPVAVRMTADDLGPRLPEPGLAWGTVVEVDWNPVIGAWDDIVERWSVWLAHPNLRRVTRLRHVPAVLANRLGASTLPVRSLEMGGDLLRTAPGVFDALSALRHLTRVELPDAVPSDVALCASSPLAARLEHFEATRDGAWTVEVTRAAEVPVRGTLLSERHVDAFATVLRAAARFNAYGLHVRCPRRLDTLAIGRLREATSEYARVDWE